MSPLDPAAIARLSAREPGALRALRELALARALALPEPTGREEDWRRTDPRWFSLDPWLPAPPPERVEPGESEPLDASFDVVLHCDGGQWSVSDRSGDLARGRLSVEPLPEAVASGTDTIERLWSLAPVPSPDDRFEWIAQALHSTGFLVRVKPGEQLSRGLLIRRRAPAGVLSAPALLIDVGEGAALHIADIDESSGPGAAVSLGFTRFAVARQGSLHLAHLQLADGETARMGFTHGVLASDAKLEAVTVQAGAKTVRSRVSADAAGSGAMARIGGLLFAGEGQHLDQQTLQIHSAPDTESDLLYKGAVAGNGRSIYRGLIAAHRGAVRINAYQKNNNLLLNDGARADSLPGLLIDADDLKCSHGSTIGSLDPDQILYLRSRGLSEPAARRLILDGFFEEITSRLALPKLRDIVRRLLASRLPR